MDGRVGDIVADQQQESDDRQLIGIRQTAGVRVADQRGRPLPVRARHVVAGVRGRFGVSLAQRPDHRLRAARRDAGPHQTVLLGAVVECGRVAGIRPHVHGPGAKGTLGWRSSRAKRVGTIARCCRGPPRTTPRQQGIFSRRHAGAPAVRAQLDVQPVSGAPPGTATGSGVIQNDTGDCRLEEGTRPPSTRPDDVFSDVPSNTRRRATIRSQSWRCSRGRPRGSGTLSVTSSRAQRPSRSARADPPAVGRGISNP